MLVDMNSLRIHWTMSLLCLLLLTGASRGMPQPREYGTDWEQCKTVSQEIIQQLWKLGEKPFTLKTNTPDLFPMVNECEDHCDPESLGNANKMYCLEKIGQGLLDYQSLLGWFSQAQSIRDLQSSLKNLSSLLQKDPGITKKIYPSKISRNFWQYEPLKQHTLWRLQSFSVMVARVFAHTAALNAKIQQ